MFLVVTIVKFDQDLLFCISECDLVCDGITKAAGNLQASSRSGQNTPDCKH